MTSVGSSPGMSQLHIPTIREVPCTRTYFYVGGEYVAKEKSHFFTNQMYVEQLDPIHGPRKPHPLVFIHGLGQCGTVRTVQLKIPFDPSSLEQKFSDMLQNWLNKPDGGRGWASFFLEQGYRVYLVDCTVRGRSPSLVTEDKLSNFDAEFVETHFTACAYHKGWPQAALHTQWPGTGRIGDPIFNAYFASVVPGLVSKELQQATLQKAGAALLDRIGCPVVLFGHSQGMMPTWLMADSRPALVHAIVALEPAGPPFREAVIMEGFVRPYGLTTIPLTYSPPVADPTKDLTTQIVQPTRPGELPLSIQANEPPPRQLINLFEKPVLVVTGQASYHAPYDWATVMYLRQAGVKKTQHLMLEKHGIHGNGHMLFLEKNSDEIASLIEEWIKDLKG
ncbi:hypothetical protein MMC08_002567 [Hypocenomyce scalaris]|nr:hypothetical protein [Hypocenomyce scalaris]